MDLSMDSINLVTLLLLFLAAFQSFLIVVQEIFPVMPELHARSRSMFFDGQFRDLAICRCLEPLTLPIIANIDLIVAALFSRPPGRLSSLFSGQFLYLVHDMSCDLDFSKYKAKVRFFLRRLHREQIEVVRLGSMVSASAGNSAVNDVIFF